ncbi:MAG TPA: C1 family peptidase [Elusimicrobiota bacterium]|nr:C1 family peptidase [Elusimicrobiota bacterium]
MPTPRSSPAAQRRIARYGWIPDIPDHRDFLFSARRAAPVRLPSTVDLRATCSPIENQGQLGSCTANALAGALEFLEDKDRAPFEDVSRLFIYYNERVVEHTVKTDSGAMLRDGIKTLARDGVCSEALWPYVISRFAAKPTPRCYADGRAHTITSYERLLTLNDMRACLAAGFPFVFGFTVYESFESPQVARAGVMPMPQASERAIGGHAVMAAGYDDAQQQLICRNSWGTAWGLKGYFLMPYAYVEDRNLSDDFWTIRRGGGM